MAAWLHGCMAAWCMTAWCMLLSLHHNIQADWDRALKTSTTLYIGNLSFFTREEQVFEVFSKVRRFFSTGGAHALRRLLRRGAGPSACVASPHAWALGRAGAVARRCLLSKCSALAVRCADRSCAAHRHGP
eukprot:364308-Chlamydomonas_euryale.AAC.8